MPLNHDGTLCLMTIRADQPAFINLAVAPGNWSACFRASVFDGSLVSVEHWEGEVKRQ